jgi:flagellar hook assembly protein FlgD
VGANNLQDFSSYSSKTAAPQTCLTEVMNDISRVNLKVYDILGREVATLVNENQKAGNYEVEWNASKLPSGVYFYSLNAGEFTSTKKLILLK